MLLALGTFGAVKACGALRDLVLTVATFGLVMAAGLSLEFHLSVAFDVAVDLELSNLLVVRKRRLFVWLRIFDRRVEMVRRQMIKLCASPGERAVQTLEKLTVECE